MDHKAYLEQLSKGPIPKELPFTQEEYQQRVARVREGMGEAGLDVLLVTFPPNLFYLTGYYTFSVDNYSCLILPREGEPAMQVASLEISAALLSGWVEEVVSFDWHETGGIASQLAGMLMERGLEEKRIGVELRRKGIGPPLYRELEATLSKADFQDASDIVFKARLIKSSREIEYLREAAKITAAGIEASLAAIKTGVTDNDVAKVGLEALVGAGSEFMSTQPIVTSGHRSGWIHTNHRRVLLKVGDTVFLEFGGCYQRYTAPLMRTAIIGRPAEEVVRVTEAVKDTVNRLLEAIRPGRTCHEVAQEGHKGFAHIDSEVFFSGVYGYNVGVGFPPSWSEGLTFLAEGIDQPLHPGMAFHLPICLRAPGRFGVGLSETIVVTETGCEILTEQARDLKVVPA
ncbi:MAG: Xaa-Pro peptidase family protein [Dehalococcoidia bacterium]